MKRLIAVKFGGSSITDKSKKEKANPGEIDRLSSQIAAAVKSDKNLRFIVGNGAGSFGHIQVEKYRLKNRIETGPQKFGFAAVSNLVGYLNQLVVSSLIHYGLPAVTVKPSSIALSSDNNLKEFFTLAIADFIRKGFIPVVYGDMILDEIKGGAVLSTDRIFLELVRSLKVDGTGIDRVIFCGATDGVIDKEGNTIPKINRMIFPEIQRVFFENKYVDVTGGMKKKVETALEIARLGVKSCIISSRELSNCLLSDNFKGTLVE